MNFTNFCSHILENFQQICIQFQPVDSNLLWSLKVSCSSLQVLSPEEQALAANNDYNFDHPAAFDFELLVTTLRKLKQGKSVKIPVYDFTTHSRQKDWVSVVLIPITCPYFWILR